VATVVAVRLFAATERVGPLFVNQTRGVRSPVTRTCRDDSLLQCDAVWSGRILQKFGQKVLAPSGSWWLDPEDRRSMFLRESVYSARPHLKNLQPDNSVSLRTQAACAKRSMPCQ